MSIDRLSNMLSSLKNAAMANNSYVETYYTKECENVAKVLKNTGFLDDVKVFKSKGKSYKSLRLDLAMENGLAKITEVKRISKPGRRLYSGSDTLTSKASTQEVVVVSTSRGVMNGKDAKSKKLGGELLCKVY